MVLRVSRPHYPRRTTSARGETRVNCERYRRDTKCWVLRSRIRTLQPPDRLTSRAFPASLARLACGGRGLALPSDFGELPSTGSGPELVEGSRAAAVPVPRLPNILVPPHRSDKLDA